MKKIYLFVVAVFCATTSFAQVPVKYHGEVDAGYSLGIGLISIDRVSLHTIQGICIGKYLSTGIGLGAEYMFTNLGVDDEYGYYNGDEEDFAMLLPIYLNIKGYLPVSEKFSPYLSFDVGSGFGLSNDEFYYGGVYLNPAVGVKFGLLKVQIGYNLQRGTLESGDLKVGALNMGAMQLKVGIMF